MKVIYPKSNRVKIRKIPNWLFFNRFVFGILKLFLITKSILFFKIKYKQFKPILKQAKEYKDFEIVTVENKHGNVVKVLL